MPALYELCKELTFLTAEEELSPEVEAQLDALALALPEKVDNICRLIQEWRGQAVRFKDEAERLADIADKHAKQAERLKKYVRDCLLSAGMRTLDTEFFRLRIQNNPPSADCGGEPTEEFSRVKVEWDKKAIVEAWKAGKPMPEGVLVTTGCHLRGVS